jgi:hypothetical protein
MAPDSDEIFIDSILYLFRKKKTSFLTTETILKEVRFQKAIYPKEDKERLDLILAKMRDQDLVILNQPKLAALSPAGKAEGEKLTEARIAEIEKENKERLK